MFASDFGFLIVSALVALVASGCGVVFASIGFLQMASKPEGANPVALTSFAGTIPLNIAALVSIWWLPIGLRSRMIAGVHSTDFVISSLLFTSFVLLMVTMGQLYGYTGAGKRALKAGSISLIVLYGLGCIAVLAP